MNIKDKILEELYKTKGVGDRDFANQLAIEPEALLRNLNEIKKTHPDLISIKYNPYGDNNSMIYPVNSQRPQLAMLMASGGFEAIEKTSQERDQLQEQKLRLELDSLQLQIDSLRQQPTDNKRTRMLSWIAIGIAAIPVLIEIYHLFF